MQKAGPGGKAKTDRFGLKTRWQGASYQSDG